MEFCSKYNNLIYTHRDFLFKNGNWRGKNANSILQQPQLAKGKTIVVGHSDLSTTKIQASVFKIIGAKKLFGINVNKLNGFSEPIPLGLTNNCDDSPLHRIIGDEEHFLKAYDQSNPAEVFNGRIYANFSNQNYPKIRVPLMNILKTHPNVIFRESDFSIRGRIKFLSELRINSLTVCPRGNGIDTHRLWETLYMGGTPVIIREKQMENLVADLPVIMLNSWNEITNMNLLEKAWHDVRNKKHNYEKLKMNYWNQKIIHSQKSLL